MALRKWLIRKDSEKNIEHLPNQQALELNNAEPDITTTISNDAKQQPATSSRAAISESFSDTGIQDLGEHEPLIEH